ncbi:MAG TPA: CBS domain-containing protein [Ideonella sp.]|uniref:CBS domain-containing protein n=1 Tax=Ideonella sp. TaxID=1929293 RepID=UPI002E33E301|nr:CBS domain-containing protein [Ideonella sp.]HEX5685040.1 CBS domain-containing protein [Ideonella sp.]
MNIASISQRKVVTVDEHASLQEAAQLMRDRHVGAVVVTRGDAGASHLMGVLTDRDLALLVVAEGRSPHMQVGAALGDAGSQGLVAIPQKASIAESAEAMREAGVRRLLLIDSQGRLTGIVTLDDLIASYADQLGDIAAALERGIEHEVERSAGDVGDHDASPVLVPPDLAVTWRRVFEP